jgi:hypothetical protein
MYGSEAAINYNLGNVRFRPNGLRAASAGPSQYPDSPGSQSLH